VKNVTCSLWSKEPAKKSGLSKPAQSKTVSQTKKVAKRKRIVSEGSSDEDFVPAASPVVGHSNRKKQQTAILDSSPEILISDSD
jgi:hypothetical protein